MRSLILILLMAVGSIFLFHWFEEKPLFPKDEPASSVDPYIEEQEPDNAPEN